MWVNLNESLIRKKVIFAINNLACTGRSVVRGECRWKPVRPFERGGKVKSRDPRGNKKRQSGHERVSIVIKGLTGIGEKADTAE